MPRNHVRDLRNVRPEWLSGGATVLYQWKNCWKWVRASSIEPKRSGRSGRYFKISNCASGYADLSETRGGLGLGDIQVDQQSCDGAWMLGSHAGAAVGAPWSAC